MVDICRFFIFSCGVFLLSHSANADQGRLVDPLRPLSYQVPQVVAGKKQPQLNTDSWILSAVLISSERSVAVINGQFLQQGDRFEGYRVREIRNNEVVLQKKKHKVLLRRSGTGLKKSIR